MAYPVIADFRSASQAEFCKGITLETTDVSDSLLTGIIARMVDRIESLTDDQFVSASATYDLRGEGTRMLALPLRCTAVATVKTRDYLGNLTTQAATAYRLVSSLDSTGATRITLDALDYLEVVPYQYLTGIIGESWSRWPTGPKTVQVAGTFGWTITPPDINRAIALMVYDQVKPMNPSIRRAQSLQTSDAFIQYNPADAPTGISEADEIIRNFHRADGLLVG